MIEVRLALDPSRTQNLTTALLVVYGFCSLVSAPVIAHFADKTPNMKYLLLSSLVGCALGTSLVAWTPSGMIFCPFREGGLERFDRRLKLDVTANNISYWRYSSDESFKVFLDMPHGFLRLRCWWITSSRSVKGQL